MSELTSKELARLMRSGGLERAKQARDALMAMPPDARRRAAGGLAMGARLDGDRIALGHAISSGVFWRRALRGWNALALLRASGALDGVERLDVTEFPLPDLTPLAGLTTLRSLAVAGHGDGPLDLQPLADLGALTELTLYRCPLRDLSPLAELTSLRALTLHGATELEVAWPLLTLPNLERLALGDCARIRPRPQRVQMTDRAAVAAYRRKLARALDRLAARSPEQERWLAAARDEGLLRAAPRATDADRDRRISSRALKRLLSSPEPETALQGLELLLGYAGDDPGPALAEGDLYQDLLSASHVDVRRRGLALLIAHGGPERIAALADGISVSALGRVQAKKGLARRRYLRRLKEDVWVGLAVLGAAGRLGEVTRVDVRRKRRLSDLGPLAGAPRLERLAIADCGPGLTDLSPLAECAALDLLRLERASELTDLSPLAGLPALRRLVLLYCRRLEDLSPLTSLGSLRELLLGDARDLRDLSPLAGLTRLEKLHLSSLGSTDLGPLAGLTRLRELSFYGLPVTDLTPLAGLVWLRRLSIGGARGQAALELSPLSSLSALKQLELSGLPVAELDWARPLSSLQSVTIRDAPTLADLQALSALPDLQSLTLDTCPRLEDLTPLTRCAQLSDLQISRCGATPRRHLFWARSRADVLRLLDRAIVS